MGIAAKLQKLYNTLQLPVLVLLSLCLQVVLIAIGNRRKYSKNKWLAFVLWFSYLSADSVAILALGVLSRAEVDSEKGVDPRYTITAFWAPFLLMHLGGPDTITAYALADNELWSRHLLVLIVQVFVVVYVFIRSFTGVRLNFIGMVIFFAGFVKYGERSWVLFSASKDQFRDSMVSRPDPGPNYARFMDELVSRENEGYIVSLGKAIDNISSSYLITPGEENAEQRIRDDIFLEKDEENAEQRIRDEILLEKGEENAEQRIRDDIFLEKDEENAEQRIRDDILEKAYSFFGTFRKLFADLILSFQDRETSVSFFKDLRWKDAFSIVEIELGLVFDSFYTKSSLVFSSFGVFLRIFSCSSTVAALIAFLVIKKKGFPETEVIITYILLAVAIFLEIYGVLILFLTDRMMIWLEWDWTKRPDGKLHKIISLFYRLRVVPARKRWSNSMGQYNVLNHYIKYMPKRSKVNWFCKKFDKYLEKFKQYLDKHWFLRHEPVPDDLKEQLFNELKKRAKDGAKKSEIYWKDKILVEEMNCFDENDEVEFDQSLLLWQIATDICYTKTDQQQQLGKKVRRCRLLSDYMVHLLIVSPFMLPSGIGKIRFQDTCAEATEFFNFEKNLSKENACEMIFQVDARFKPSDVKGDRSKSLLFDACRLAKSLTDLKVGQRWDKINEAWVHMLTFAAAQCSWSDHAEKLSQGGELLTHVWLLMAHFGLTHQFQISKGYNRVKLESK